MPSDKTGDGKRKLPDPPEAMVTPDKKVPVPTGSSGSSTRRILFSERHYQKSQLGSGEMEEVQSRSRFCPQQEVMSGECAAPASVTHRKGIASRTLFGKFPSREQMGQFFESTEQQVRQAFQERWGVEASNGLTVQNGQWQWAIRGIVSGDQIQPMV